MTKKIIIIYLIIQIWNVLKNINISELNFKRYDINNIIK